MPPQTNTLQSSQPLFIKREELLRQQQEAEQEAQRPLFSRFADKSDNVSKKKKIKMLHLLKSN